MVSDRRLSRAVLPLVMVGATFIIAGALGIRMLAGPVVWSLIIPGAILWGVALYITYIPIGAA